MPTGKRKLDNFDPNKSDSNDTDFDPTEARPHKKNKKVSSKRTGNTRKRPRYKGSDVSDDDVEDSELEESFSEVEEEEDMEVTATGRVVRKAAKKAVVYEEHSDSSIGDLVQDSEDEVKTKRPTSKRGRVVSDATGDDGNDELEEGAKPRKKSKMVTLKLRTPGQRTTRAGSAARTRSGRSTEPTSAGLRRSTRAHTEEGEEFVSLSASGRHVVRASATPEPIMGRRTRGSKGVIPASTIKEEIHETSSFEQQDKQPEGETDKLPREIVGTEEPEDEPPEKSDAQPIAPEDEVDELAIEEPGPADKVAEPEDDEDEDEDEGPISRIRRRGSRPSATNLEIEKLADPTVTAAPEPRRLRSRGSKKGQDDGSDFTPEGEASEDEISASDASPKKNKTGDDDDDFTSSSRRGRSARAKSKGNSRRRHSSGSEGEDELDPEELADELQELKESKKKRRARIESDIQFQTTGTRVRKAVDYSIKPMDQIYAADEDLEDAAPTPTRQPRGGRNGAGGKWEHNLHSTYGPFGGGGGPPAVFGGPWGTGATGGVDSDSSDDENMHRNVGVGGNVGMTPTSATMGGAPGLLPNLAQTNNTDPIAAMAGTPANVGKIKSQKSLADADPLGVDQNIDFSKIGGLEGHIDQLKEMVQMPLLYPELFQKFHVTPPRGVLFHGPPGTGKTLLARALAATVGSGGQKITFYMRKGADALSKWVGEAERQLRLLFEEARKTQPSIIFFDEIDGLAPVRSSKQEQIHASIVSTLLALMDGMDGRGQVIVIGATNRPDNIDPALRRPGRFDREFYFPLPDLNGRKSIINIHTKDWGIDNSFKESLANITKGYGGADLRALCTEAALNAMQRTYPQIYSSNEKLVVDPEKIKITAKDFMISVKKMVPSSERSTSSGAAPLPKVVEPLLRDQLKEIEDIVDGLIPIKKKTTALQEAMYEQYEDDDAGFGRETMQQDFERSRVFRPRLLIGGENGMGQAYLGGALLNHFEGLHVQSFDLPTIYSDSARVSLLAIITVPLLIQNDSLLKQPLFSCLLK